MHEVRSDFRLGDAIARPLRCVVERDGELVRVKPRSMAVLECLAREAGNVVTRDRLFDTVWAGGIVSDDALTQCVVELRKAFGDSARDARIIETIPKVGFRLLPEVVPLETGAEPADGADRQPVAAQGGDGRKTIVAVSALLLAVVLATVFFASNRSGAPEPAATPAGSEAKSIAVLPFVDMSPDKDQEFFADGLSEELINKLTHLDGLLVTGRTSSFFFKGRNEDLRVIGERLDVNHVLEGSVRKSADQLRIAAQLIDVNSGFHLWSNTFDRPLEDIFAVQEEIAESVATALSIKLSVGELGRFHDTTDIGAYEQYLKGNSIRWDTPANTVKAIEHFRRATEIDPDYAVAWVALSGVYLAARLYIHDPNPFAWQQQSEQALAEAIRLAPTSPMVMSMNASIQTDLRRWPEVERIVAQSDERAGSRSLSAGGRNLSLSLSSYYVDFLTKVGRASDAIPIIERVLRVDPLNKDPSLTLGHLYAMQGRFDEAMAQLERAYELEGFRALVSTEGMSIALTGDDGGLLQTWLDRAGQHQVPDARAVNGPMASMLDDRDAALRWLNDAFAEGRVADYWIGIWAGYHGDNELLLKTMQRTPDPWSLWMPPAAEVRRMPAFKEIVRDMGLESYWREYGWSDFCRPVGDDDFECG